MKLSVSETAKLMEISVRTLHYYDEISLLSPSEISESGYRYYRDEAIDRLQQILFYRELEFSLKDIGDILSNPDYDKRRALKNHRELLVLKRKHIDELIELVDDTLGGNTMKKPITADEIEEAKRKYSAETAEKWGKTDAYAKSSERHSSYSSDKEIRIAEEADSIFAEFAENMDKEPSSPEIQALVKKWRDHISKYHYPCSKKILAGLGKMYVCDERFTETLDRFADGNAKFMSDAIEFYCKQ